MGENEPQQPRAEIDVSFDARVNFAMQQNAVPFVHRIGIRNPGEEPLENLTVTLRTEPEVARSAAFPVALVPVGETFHLDPVDLPLQPGLLMRQTEREAGRLEIAVTLGEETIATRSEPIEVLAYDEWSGTGSLPEILAAFVLPNHPVVEQLLAAARDLLKERGVDPSFDGYESRDPAKALAVVRAVYDAICGLGATYIAPPASFEKEGQRIRTPDRIAEARMGTCLDLAALAAACLEQAGLHPLVVLTRGHAFGGCWLSDESFADPCMAEPLRLRKRAEIDTIALFETTGATAQPPQPFERARDAAIRHLEDPAEFEYALDVHAARRAHIRPIPLRATEGTYAVVVEESMEPAAEAPAPSVPVVPAEEPEPESPRTRLERWKRRLLDLTLRNRLLNHRETKKTIPLLCPDLATLEDALARGAAFPIHEAPELMEGDDPRDKELYKARTGEDALDEFLRSEMADGRLHSSLKPEELERRLLEAHRTAKSGIEESGANTLYLALGFLHWYETPTSKDLRRAPILLVPVQLTRNSAREGFKVRLLDDDTRVNVTLLQKLESDFDLKLREADLLPEDEAGIDVELVLRRMREAVLQFDRWEVKAEAQIGLFSFTKYLMWLDLEQRAEVLKTNRIVDHLVERPDETFDPAAAFLKEESLDHALEPGATFCPLDADSSQLRAIHAAAAGQTFVLLGPPGTGKSQTITNLIAHCLAVGQRVLFVSEKMAALEVVHRRLERVGLGPFTMAVHSHRASKREALEQLREALEVDRAQGDGAWAQRAQRLKEARERVNEYRDALHDDRGPGRSLFDAVAGIVGRRDVPAVPVELGPPGEFEPARMDALDEAVDLLEAEAREAGPIAGHPLLPVGLDHWEPGLEDQARDACEGVAGSAARLGETIEPVAEALKLPSSALSQTGIGRLRRLRELLQDRPVPGRPLLVESDWEETSARLQATIRRGRERDLDRATLLERYETGIFDLHLQDLQARLERGLESFALFRFFIARPARKALAAVSRTRRARSDRQMIEDLQLAQRVRSEAQELVAADGGLFGSLWKGGEADWDQLESRLEWAAQFRDLLAETAGGDVALHMTLREAWVALVTEGADLLAGPLDTFEAAHAEHLRARAALVERLRLDEARAYGSPDEENYVGRAESVARSLSEAAGRLRDWCGYRRAADEAVRLGLGDLVGALESGEVEALKPALARSIDQWIADDALSGDALLSDFSRTRQNMAVERFRQSDEAILDLASEVIGSRLAARVPRGGAEETRSSSSEMGLLHRELGKRRRHLPLRRLFERIPNVLARLKPCLLMSPLSVAHYLAPDFPRFDLVVFDEASQIPVWDAIGAIARGERLVVVGDTKQLPPTTFFMREESEEGFDEDEVADLESILDECVAARLPALPLRWHYRSRHESLITFSNYHYYDNRLLTFPNSIDQSERLGVTMVEVPDGCYEKGRSRTNPREAEALVEDLVQRLLDPVESQRSYGVVTFSMAQQTLIEDLLEAARRDEPGLEEHFGSRSDEPVFVKNLENVQGDERDVIFFSVCYGPDANGRVSMNFGPLNREGGERRLNVAITRAREQVRVFSTLRADQIDLSRSRAVGVRHLRAFLDYAARGRESFAEAHAVDRDANWETDFERDVAAALEERGWRVERQVGCSGYRVDLAVPHPDEPGRFLLGIECDGAMYRDAKTARDRDRLRSSVLEGLGWRLHRIWSLDWLFDRERETDRLVEALESALRDEPPPEPELPEEEEVVEEEGPMPREGRANYPATPEGKKQGDRDRLLEGKHDGKARRVIESVLKREAPISLELLARRVAARWEITRLTANVVECIERLIPEAGGRIERDDHEEIVWRSEQVPAEYLVFRAPRDAEQPEREADEIAIVEIANAARFVLSAHVSLVRSDLAREVARQFGIGRMGPKVQARMDLGIDRLLASGAAVLDEDVVRLPD